MSQPLKLSVVLAALALSLSGCGDGDEKCEKKSCSEGQTCDLLDGKCKAPPEPQDAGPCGTVCAAPTPYCDEENGRCRACRSTEGCSGATPVCDLAAEGGLGACAQCTDDTHCSSPTPLCNQQTLTCGALQTDAGPADAGGPGESCATVTTLDFAGTSTAQLTVDTRGYVHNYAAECAPSTVRGPDTVHRITLGAPSDLSVRATGHTSVDPAISLRGASLDGGEACVRGSVLGCSGKPNPSDGGVSVERLDLANLSAGDYYLHLDTAGDGAGPVDLVVTRGAPTLPPANDACSGAQPLVFTAGKASATGSTFGATNSTGPDDVTPTCNGFAQSAGPDVVYTYTLAANTDVVVNIAPVAEWPDFGPVVYARKRQCTSGELADQLSCAGSGNAGPRTFRLPNQPPGTYWLFVDTGSAAGGAFTLDLTLETPTNDGCDVALPLAFNAGVATASGNTTGGSNSNVGADGGAPTMPDCSSVARNSARDLVYSYQLTAPQDVQVLVTPSAGFQPVVYVRGTNACASDRGADQLACSAPPNATGPNRFTLYNQAPGTYYLWVDGANATAGPFNLEVTLGGPTPMPANDTCAAPTPVAFGANGIAVFGADTRIARSDYVGGCNKSRVNSSELVYKISLPAAQDLRVQAREAGDAGVVDPVIYLRASPCETGAELACNDSNRGTPDVITRPNLAAGDYYLFVETYGTATAGPITVTATLSAPTGVDGGP